MKKLFILLILTSIFVTSCNMKDVLNPDPVPNPEPDPDPIPKVEYVMPFLSTNKLEVKAELLKITDKVEETKHKDYYRVTCVPTKSETNMFSYLSYEYSLDGFDFKDLNFTYKLDKSLKLTKKDKEKLITYLESIVLK